MLARDEAIATGAVLMLAFAERTGLAAGEAPRRYLWTDAFAVCNFLGLARATGDGRHADLALRLIDQVHRVLGRHRSDDSRAGWLSGLAEQEGAAHPTRGGLRIGKPLPERRPDEAFDEELEWERDGQYFHYLTKWMHALDQTAGTLRDPRYNVWARELAAAAHAAFVRTDASGRRRMVWKASIDLSRPLVDSMGQHDPLDGRLTCVQLEQTAARLAGSAGPPLAAAIRDFAELSARVEVRTADALGLGVLLADASRAAQLSARGARAEAALLARLLASAQEGLGAYARLAGWRRPPETRLAFRELGLAIGLSALELLAERIARGEIAASDEARSRLRALSSARPLREALLASWLESGARRAPSWSAHRDINDVMLATSLLPEAFLVLEAPGGGERP